MSNSVITQLPHYRIIVPVAALLVDRFLKTLAYTIPPLSADFLFAGFGFVPTRTTNVFGMVPLGNSVALVLVTLALAILIIGVCKNYSSTRILNDSSFFCLIFLGGFSNLYDRVMSGAVIDVFRITINTHLFVFNIADSMIVAGVFMVLRVHSKQQSVIGNQ